MNPGCETINVCISRQPRQPWGFRLQGGADFTTPLSIQSIVPGSPSDLSGLKPGDAVLTINGQSSDELSHDQAKQVIMQASNQVDMLVQRGAVKIWKPKVTPLSQLKPGEMRQVGDGSEDQYVQRTSLAADKQDVMHIGSSHNRAPKPFPGFGGGNGFGGGTAPAPSFGGAAPVAPGFGGAAPAPAPAPMAPAPAQMAPAPAPTAPSIVHSQYNSPMQMYTNDNVANTYDATASQLSQNIASLKIKDEPNNNNTTTRSASPALPRSRSPAYLTPASASLAPGGAGASQRSVSPTLALLQEQERGASPSNMSERYKDYQDGQEMSYKGYVDHSKQSRSFRLLNQELEGGAPPAAPAAPAPAPAPASGGFRSVKAPTTLPPDQRPQQPQLSTCAVCGSLCVGVFVRIKGKPMHPECYKCVKCGLNLKQKGFFEIEGSLYCEQCARQVAAPPEPGMELEGVVYR